MSIKRRETVRRREQVRELTIAGLSSGEIADRLQISRNSVVSIWRINGGKRAFMGDAAPPLQTPRPRALALKSLSRVADERITEEARRRSVTRSRLAEQILNVISRDNLFVAVLDQ